MDTGPRDAPAYEDWLAVLARAAEPSVLIGGTGHLDLAPDEERRVAAEVELAVVPQFIGLPGSCEIRLLTGLAPGSDLVIAEAVTAGLARQGRRCEHVGLLPVPAEVLWQDWLERAGQRRAAQAAAIRLRFEHELRGCARVVRLWDASAPPDWADRAARQRQYQRLAAVLAEQCDVLVAVLRPDHRGQPGGTSEVVAWRERRRPIPPELAAGTRRHRSAWPAGDRLVVVNPAAQPPALPKAREALRSGNYLLAYDLAVQSRRPGEVSDELEYVRLQALANAGSTQAALRRFEELPPELRERNEDWLALAGRLHKDIGMRAGADAPAHFARAAACYRTAFERTGGYFSAINAATTSLLAGDATAARMLAARVLQLVAQADADHERRERDRYFMHATEAEAALLLDDTARARAALARANGLLSGDINARSRTRRQLRVVCRAMGIDASALDNLRLPPVFYVGADRWLAEGALPAEALACVGITAPRELEAAERVLELGGRLHAVLAAPREAMVRHWEGAHGASWAARLEQLVGGARELSVALGFLDTEDQWCDAYVGAMAVGLSRLAASRLDCEWRAVGVDGETTRDIIGAIAPRPAEAHGVRFTRRFAGVIFADFAGFSRLQDAELPVFWAHFMRAIAARLAPLGRQVLFRHTWGDALHLVLDSAKATAEAGCAIQDCLDHLQPSLPGALAGLELRLAAHYAPVFAGRDPVEDVETFFGTQLSFTARIEPVTPPGMIFVTEAFAAQLALEAPNEFALEYAGEVALAKGYGQSRLFSLRRTL